MVFITKLSVGQRQGCLTRRDRAYYDKIAEIVDADVIIL